MAKSLPLEAELAYFIANQTELVKKYPNQVLVIKERHVIGVYNDALEAYLKTQEHHTPGTFMIQPCLPGPEAYTATISSSVKFK